MLDGGGLNAVTTASPFVAACVKKNFPQIDVRASVNMGVGSVMGLTCLAPYFDSFYAARELNRFPDRIRPLKTWCADRGKRLYLLANSGCLRGCEEGTHFFQYPSMGYGGINEFCAPTVLYETAKFIEDHGYEGIVYRNTGGRSAVSDMTGIAAREESPELHRSSDRGGTNTSPNVRSLIARSVAPDLPAPDVFIHFRIAAFLCDAACQRACLAHLESSGLLARAFVHPFRDKAPWRLDRKE